MGQPDDIKGVTLGNWSRGELYAHDILDVSAFFITIHYIIESKPLVYWMGRLEHGFKHDWRTIMAS